MVSDAGATQGKPSCRTVASQGRSWALLACSSIVFLQSEAEVKPTPGASQPSAALTARIALQVRKLQLSRLQESQQLRTACLLPFDFTSLVDGISSGMFTELDDIQEQIESICRDAAEKLAQDLGTGYPLLLSVSRVSDCSLHHCINQTAMLHL